MKRRNLLIGVGALAAVGAAGGVSVAGMGSIDEYNKAMAASRAPLKVGADARDLVRYATLAANGHNTQPWRFQLRDKAIRIVPDLTRRTPAVDPDDHHLYVSLGCAAENMTLAGASSGFVGAPRFDPAGDGAVVFEYASGAAQASALCDAIPLRQSTRADFDGRTPPADTLKALAEAAKEPGVDTMLITDRAQIDRVKDIVLAGNTIQMADRAFMAEFKHWMRFNPNAALKHGDGLFSASSGNPALPSWLGGPMLDLVFTAEAENAKYVKQFATAGGVAVFAGESAAPAHWVAVGRACQRFALQATALGLKLSFVNQPVEVEKMRPELAKLIGLPGRRPDIVMRFGYGAALPYSARRPVDAVIDA